MLMQKLCLCKDIPEFPFTCVESGTTTSTSTAFGSALSSHSGANTCLSEARHHLNPWEVEAVQMESR